MRAPLVFTDESRKLLTELSGSMMAPAQEVVRAKVLLHYSNGAEIDSIKRPVEIGNSSLIQKARQ